MQMFNNQVMATHNDKQTINYDQLQSQIIKSIRSNSHTFKQEVEQLFAAGTHHLSVNIVIAALLKKNQSKEHFKMMVDHIQNNFKDTKMKMQMSSSYVASQFYKLVNADHFQLNVVFALPALKRALDLIIDNNYFSIFKIFIKLLDLDAVEDCFFKDKGFMRVVNSKYIDFIYYVMRYNDETIPEVYINIYHQNFNTLLQNKDELIGSHNNLVDFLIENKYEEILIQAYLYGKMYIEVDQETLIQLYKNDFVIFLEIFGNFSHTNRSLFLQRYFFKFMMKNKQTNKQFMFQLEVLLKLTKQSRNILDYDQQQQMIVKYEWLIQNPEYLECRYINQLYVMCLVYVLLHSMLSKWNQWNIRIHRLKEQYMEIIQNIINKIDDDYALKVILFYPHNELDNRSLIAFIQEHDMQFIDILNQSKVARVIHCQWQGNRQSYFNFMKETYVYQMLTNTNIKIESVHSKDNYVQDVQLQDETLKQQIQTIKQIIENDKDNQQSYNIISILNSDVNKQQMNEWKRQNFFYQFDVYNQNFQIRRIIDFIVIIVLFGAFFYIAETGLINLSTSYQTWTPNYTDIFQYKIPSIYSSSMTLNTTQMNILNDEQNSRNNPQYFMNYCDSLFNKVYSFSSTSSSLKSTLQTYCTAFKNFTLFIYSYNVFLQIIFFFTFNLSFKTIIKIIYAYLTKSDRKTSKLIVFEILVMFVTIYLMFQADKITQLNDVSTKQLQFYENLRTGSILIIVGLYLLLIKATKTFKGIGFQVLILIDIIKRITYFIVFYLTIIIAVSLIFYIMFASLDSKLYGTLANSFLTVFSNPLGTYNPISDSTSYSDLKSIKVYVHNTMAVGFQFYMMVVFLNVIIAILNNIYEEMANNSRKEYSLVIHRDYVTYNPNIHFSAIINVPDTVSILGLIVAPLLYYARSQKLNRMFNILWYFMYMLLLFIPVHLILNLMLIPVVYIKMLFQIISTDYKDKFSTVQYVSIPIKIVYLLTYWIVGPFHLVYQYIQDFKHLLSKLFKQVDETHFVTFEVATYKTLKQTINHFIQHNQTQVSFEDFQSVFQQIYQNVKQQQFSQQVSDVQQNDDRLDRKQHENMFRKMESMCKNGQVQISMFKQYLEDIKVHSLYLDQSQKYKQKLQQLEIIFSRQTI